MAKTVVGNYAGATDVKYLVDRLISEGYPPESITVIATKAVAKELDDTGVVVERDFQYIDDASDETLWDRIKAFFGADNTKVYEGDIAAYTSSIRNGNTLVLVDDAYAPTTLSATYEAEAKAPIDTKKVRDRTLSAQEDETIRLEAERMQVDKQAVQTGEAVIHKRVVENVKTVEVPLRHEEVIIERRAVADEAEPNPDFDEETITIPVMEEQVQVTKKPVVTEEIKVRKRDVEDMREVSATLREEKLDVEEEGKVPISQGVKNNKK